MARRLKPTTVQSAQAAGARPLQQPQWRAHAARRWGGRLLTGAIVLGLVGGLAALWRAGLLNDPVQPESSASRAGPRHAAQDVEQRLAAARTLILQGEPDRALAAIGAAVIEYPDDQDLRVAYAETFLQLERLPEAYEQFVAALSIGPREPAIEFAAGTLASRIGRPQLAIEHFSVAQAADPTNADYPLYLGQAHLSIGELVPAKACLVRAALLRDDDPRPWGMLAEIALQENVTDIALQHITRARALQPSEPAWKMIEARAMKRKGEPEQALRLLRSMNEQQQLTGPVVRLMAECHGMLRESDVAAALLCEAADTHPDDPSLALDAALWLERTGDRDRALAYAERAVSGGAEGAEKVLTRIAGVGDR
ncbi:MAG: tetratricopeptide repeat protein [Phycisphaerales bacterium JB039]